MGVGGLTSYLKDKNAGRQLTFQPDKHQSVTKKIICVDGCGLIRKFFGQKVGARKNVTFSYQWDFDTIRLEIAQYVHDWDACGFRLVVFIDAGVDDCKINTWEKRRSDSMNKMLKLARGLEEHDGNAKLVHKSVWTPPPSCTQRLGESFEAAGCRVIYCKYEADKEMAAFYLHHGCFGLLGADSDFFVMPITLYLDLSTERHTNRGQIIVEAYYRDRVLQVLGLREDQMSQLAAHAGNDYVGRSKAFEKKITEQFGKGKNDNMIDLILKEMAQEERKGQENRANPRQGSTSKAKKKAQAKKSGPIPTEKGQEQYTSGPTDYSDRSGSLRKWVKDNAYNIRDAYPSTVGMRSALGVKLSTGKLISAGFHADFRKPTFGTAFREVRQAVYSRLGYASIYEIYPVLNGLEPSTINQADTRSEQMHVQDDPIDDEVEGEVIMKPYTLGLTRAAAAGAPIARDQDQDVQDMADTSAGKLIHFQHGDTNAKHHPVLSRAPPTENLMQVVDYLVWIMTACVPGYITNQQVRAFRAQLLYPTWAASLRRRIQTDTDKTRATNIHATATFITLFDLCYSDCDLGEFGMWSLLSGPAFHFYCENATTHLVATEEYIADLAARGMVQQHLLTGRPHGPSREYEVSLPTHEANKAAIEGNLVALRTPGITSVKVLSQGRRFILQGTYHAAVEMRSNIELMAFNNTTQNYALKKMFNSDTRSGGGRHGNAGRAPPRTRDGREESRIPLHTQTNKTTHSQRNAPKSTRTQAQPPTHTEGHTSTRTSTRTTRSSHPKTHAREEEHIERELREQRTAGPVKKEKQKPERAHLRPTQAMRSTRAQRDTKMKTRKEADLVEQQRKSICQHIKLQSQPQA